MIQTGTQIGLNGAILQVLSRFLIRKTHLLFLMQLVKMVILLDTKMWMKEAGGILARKLAYIIGRLQKILMIEMGMVLGTLVNLLKMKMVISNGMVQNLPKSFIIEMVRIGLNLKCTKILSPFLIMRVLS